MKQIITRRSPKTPAAPISLSAMLSDSLRLRKTIQTNLSGYPTGSHLIGRIMQRFNFNSKTELMESILRLRNLTSVAAEILDRYISTQTNKYAFVRTEIITVITDQAPLLGYNTLTPLDIELIAALILETETDLSSWILQCGSAEDNFHIKMNKLYSECSSSAIPEFGIQESTRKVKITSGPAIPVYDPELDNIVPLTSTRRAQTIAAEISNEGTADHAYLRLSNLYTVHQFAFMRVLDHVYSLFMDIDIWRNFVSVRLEQNATSNKERVKSLKVFSSYLHSLLMYSHFFTLEAFRGMYSQLELFKLPFPPIAAHIIQKYEIAVSSKDTLGAKQDVADIFAACHISGDTLMDEPVIGLPLEFLDTFGLHRLLEESEKVAAGLSVPLKLDDLKMLNDPKLNQLLMSQPIERFNMLGSITKNLLVGNLVESEINDAIMAINPGLQRYFSEDHIANLKAANFRVKFGIAYPTAVSLDPTTCDKSDLVDNALHFNPLLHRQSTSLELNLQREQIFVIKKGSQFVNDYHQDKVIVNRDLMKSLENHLGYKWNSLVPAQIGRGIAIRDREGLLRDVEIQRVVLESISNQSYNFIGKTINNPQNREIWATFISSFGLLYTFPSKDEVPMRNMGKKSETVANDAINAYLRPGYGMPYGTSYFNLASKQGPASPSDFFQVDEEGLVYIRVLKRVPLPDDALSVSREFYLNMPYYYYMSNGATMEVKSFVMDEGLQNFALVPTMYAGYHPNLILDKLSSYLNDSVFMNVDYTFIPKPDTRCKQSIPVVEKAWRHDKLIGFLDYKYFGSYSDLSASTSTLDAAEKESTLNKMVTEMEDVTKKIIEESPSKKMNDSNKDAIKDIKIDVPKIGLDEDGKRKSNTSLKKDEAKESDKNETPEDKKKKKDDKDNFDDALNG